MVLEIAGAPFSRSIGLRKGFDYAMQLSASKGEANPLLFAIDNSVTVPVDFTRRVMHNTRCGISAYAPICKRMKDDGEYWAQFGCVEALHLYNIVLYRLHSIL